MEYDPVPTGQLGPVARTPRAELARDCGFPIRRSEVARSFHLLNVSLRSTASRAGVTSLIPPGSTGYESGRRAFLFSEIPGGVSGLVWSRAHAPVSKVARAT